MQRDASRLAGFEGHVRDIARRPARSCEARFQHVLARRKLRGEPAIVALRDKRWVRREAIRTGRAFPDDRVAHCDRGVFRNGRLRAMRPPDGQDGHDQGRCESHGTRIRPLPPPTRQTDPTTERGRGAASSMSRRANAPSRPPALRAHGCATVAPQSGAHPCGFERFPCGRKRL